MKAETFRKRSLRQPQLAAGGPDIHEHNYMRRSICPQELLCDQAFGAPPGTAYARRMEAFAQNVKRLIERERGQTALAAAIGVNQSTISKWKNGGAIKDMAPVVRMAELAGVTVEQLLGQPIPEKAQGATTTAPVVSLPVVLPTVDALKAMFAAMLVGMENQDPDEIARRLAEGLPRGLMSALGGQPARQNDEPIAHAELAQSHAKHHPEVQ